MTQAINLIDGLDGLAAGIVAISAGAFFLYTMRLMDVGLLQPGNLGPLLAVIVLGMCIGFLPWNVHPARIFMGDCGALLLGLLMAASTMVVGGRTDQSYSGSAFFFYAPLFIPLLILGVPILDTAWAIVRRATRGKGVATADKDHLHHRLMRLGHGYWRSVLILWAWTALLSGLVLYPTYTGQGNAYVVFGLLGLGLALFTFFHPSTRRWRKPGETTDEIERDELAHLLGAATGARDGDIDIGSAGSVATSTATRRRTRQRAGATSPGRRRKPRTPRSSRPLD
jgi:UDP-GlcNAc:undecaprenyl-phosphate GlcNAc-1-phosphate transferase